jgi:hypothetical protein
MLPTKQTIKDREGMMMQNRCYATFALYSKQVLDLNSVIELLGVHPTRENRKNNNDSYFFSTRDKPGLISMEDHLLDLMSQFQPRTDQIKALVSQGGEIRIWTYLSLNDLNHSFVIYPEFVAWLCEIGADICMDLWQGEDIDG